MKKNLQVPPKIWPILRIFVLEFDSDERSWLKIQGPVKATKVQNYPLRLFGLIGHSEAKGGKHVWKRGEQQGWHDLGHNP